MFREALRTHRQRIEAVVVIGAVVSSLLVWRFTSHPNDAGMDPVAVSAVPQRFDRTVRRTLRSTSGASVRDIDVQVWVPQSVRPVPVVVFAHGIVGHPDRFADLFRAWTSAGYAVIAPRFPNSAFDAPGITEDSALHDLINQPGDLAAAVDDVLADVRTKGTPLFGRMDPHRMVLSGLSLGGATALLAGYNECCRDDRYKAVMAFSPVELAPEGAGAFRFDGRPPLLIIHGTDDQIVPYSESQKLFDKASSPVDFVTLDGGSHSGPFEQEASPFDDLVRRVTVEYLNSVFGDAVVGDALVGDGVAGAGVAGASGADGRGVDGSGAARRRMVATIQSSGLASIQSK